ncbi:Hypothetical predicted protein [Lecanosticta acicola]|uniref:GDP/GTP exchange factor Sec2 N-terminal domain-containing protein n=1 Tax=Lecanosticta acicola TaxID=111012 RepID=A0AAI8VVH0_9PEZI|nr:Hypothetical predicted protein [Lecanosticta acicola]
MSSSKPDDFLFVSGWGHGGSSLKPTTSRPSTLTRSQTPTPTTPAKSRFAFTPRLMKSMSTPNINQQNPSMAAAGPTQAVSALRDDHGIMDTRTPSPVQRTISEESNESSDPDYKPDLSAEVAMLSTKLVNAINFQTNLDDSLQQTRHELEQTRQRCATLEEQNRKHEELVKSGELVKRSETDKVMARLRVDLGSEKAARLAAEKARKQTDAELENLTTQLFEEANNMVAAARKDTEAAEKRIAQLKSELQNRDMLLDAQAAQLQDLKGTMERLQTQTPPGADPSVPSTPVMTNTAIFDALQQSPNASTLSDLPPEHPLHFSQLISPVLRNDTTGYTDFQDLLLLARRLGAPSRTNSNAGTPSLGGSVGSAASTSSPILPGSFSFAGNSSPSSSLGGSIPPLKDSKFYKRVLTEDIEPTLRLDLAPGLSFLSRRTVLGSLLQGTLAVEPYPHNKHYFACTLCGESRRNEPYQRKYRFRTSEDDNASKPLCDYCVSRLRATCDFVGFLRMVRDGHWKCDSEDDMKSGWEESVRLRERMFWTRVGGGVVPCLQLQKNADATPSSAAAVKSGRQSLESIPEGHRIKNLDAEISFFEGESERPKSAIGQAIVGMASGAAAVATPDLQPQQTEENNFVTPPPSSHLSLEEADALATASPQPTTPFEDAVSEPQMSVEEPNSQDALARSEAALSAKQDEKPESMEKNNEVAASEDQPSEEEPQRRGSIELETSSLHVAAALPSETTPRSSYNVERPQSHQRNNSSVLARVRAMEAGKN